jgi:imidazoleglycerol phosphate synthase glutamine amidotransferase subunit HisH
MHYATQYKQVKRKQYVKRSRQALKVPGVWWSQVSNKVVSPAAFNPRKYFWYSFLLKCGRKDNVNEKLQRHHPKIGILLQKVTVAKHF